MSRLSLGGLIDALLQRPADQCVVFGFGATSPTTIGSYRGYYCDAALGFDEGGWKTVTDLIVELRDGMARTHTGWKGGDYSYNSDSRLWVANPGHNSGTVVVGVEECTWMTVLRTAWVP